MLSRQTQFNAESNQLHVVWGPEPIRLGFIGLYIFSLSDQSTSVDAYANAYRAGAPIATVISYYLISLASIVYGTFFVPHTAWHPLSRRTFANLGEI
jgi:multidrug resistance protein, MATE family